ncbi:MAG TPA: hypothetical protein VFS40_13710 [Gemmatimonadales bacterium]|nr:hypothetical protein [Gemmatimonadales bacterium]
MRHTIRAGLALGALVLVSVAGTLRAQSPTPEGTVITNKATASWSDANGNTYTPVEATVSMTVGFLGGPDVSGAASVSPASPSTGNELAFTLTNSGNGVDSFTVATTAGAGVTVSGYQYGAGTYATLALLNDALSAAAVPAGGSITVTVVYTVAPALGGSTTTLALTATSRRDTGKSDSVTTNVQPPAVAGVSVTPDGATANKLPGTGKPQTQTFTVTNNGNQSETFSLSAALGGAGTLTIVSVDGTAGTSAMVAVAPGASATVDVVYEVLTAASTGATETITLTATSGNDTGVSDAGTLTVTVVRSAVAITKKVFRDDKSTEITGADRVLPNDFVQYQITVTASGADATGVKVTDTLPSEVTFDSTSDDGAGWTYSRSGQTVTADLSGALTNGTTSTIWIRVQVK